MSGEKKETYHHHDQPPLPSPPPYGTFQGVANHPPQTTSGFPQPVPPPGISGAPQPTSDYYAHGYQAVVPEGREGRPLREPRLPCCGIGLGWFLFILGFFLGSIPWYVGVLLLYFSRIDPREKPGYVGCTIAAVLATFAFIFGMTRI